MRQLFDPLTSANCCSRLIREIAQPRDLDGVQDPDRGGMALGGQSTG